MRRSSKPEALDESACKRQALDLLARREHSRAELVRKLEARSFPEALVATTLDHLERTGVLAQQRFAESFIRERVSKGQGPRRIRIELVNRGIDDKRAAALLAEAEVDWPELANAVRVKRFGSARPGDFKERARQARFLQYRGFDHAHIDAALDLRDDSD